MSIKALWDERTSAATELRSLYDSASGRELSAEEVGKEERLSSTLKTIDERVGNLLEERQRATDLEAAIEKSRIETRGRQEEGAPDRFAQENAALKSFLSGETRSVSFAPGAIENRALSPTAGYTSANTGIIPTFYDQLVEHMTEHSTVLQTGQATILRTASGANIQVPRTTTTSTASIIGEGSVIPESNPAFDTVTLGAYKLGFLTGISSELATDEYVNLVEYLARQGGRALGDGLGAYLVTGSGSDQPNGIDNATVGVTSTSAATITFDDLIDLEHTVVAGYRRRGSFIVNDDTVKILRKVKDGNEQYIWQPSVTAGVPDTVLTHPVYTDPNMAKATAGLISVVFGDLSCYTVRFAGPVRIDRSDEYGFAQDLVYYRFLFRADGDIVDTNGLRTLKQHA